MSKLNKIIHLGILRTVPRFLFNCLNHVLWPGHISYLNSSAIASVFQKGLFVNRGQLSIGFCVTAFFLGRLVVSERSVSGSSIRTRQERMPAAFHGCCLQGTFGHYPHGQSVVDTHTEPGAKKTNTGGEPLMSHATRPHHFHLAFPLSSWVFHIQGTGP